MSASGGVAGGKEVSRDFWSWKTPVRAEREQLAAEKRERVGRRAAQESTAGKDGIGEIDMAFVPGSAMRGIHGPGRGLGKIENEEAGKNLLKDEFRLLCVEMDQTYGIFQTSEGCFNAPAHGVEPSQGGYRKLVGGEVGDESLRFAAGGLQTDDTEGQFVKIRAFWLQKVKNHAGRDAVIRFWGSDSPHLQLPPCQTTQGEPDRDVKLRLVRQSLTVRHGPILVPDADQVVPALFLQVGQIVAGFIIPVGQQNRFS